MGKQFSVDSQGLNEVAAKLSDFSQRYAEISKQLMQRAETMGSAWESPDNLAYVAQIQGLTDDLQRMSEKLQVDSETLMKQSQLYTQRMEDNISQVKKLAN